MRSRLSKGTSHTGEKPVCRTLSVRQEEEAYAPNTWPVVVSTTIIVEPWPAQSRVKVARELPCTELEKSSTQSFTCDSPQHQ